MIGINILYNADLFLRAFNDLQGDIAVHTWTHRYMSTLSNEDLVAEFGWSMEIIKNSTVCPVVNITPPCAHFDTRAEDFLVTGGLPMETWTTVYEPLPRRYLVSSPSYGIRSMNPFRLFQPILTFL